MKGRRGDALGDAGQLFRPNETEIARRRRGEEEASSEIKACGSAFWADEAGCECCMANQGLGFDTSLRAHHGKIGGQNAMTVSACCHGPPAADVSRGYQQRSLPDAWLSMPPGRVAIATPAGGAVLFVHNHQERGQASHAGRKEREVSHGQAVPRGATSQAPGRAQGPVTA